MHSDGLSRTFCRQPFDLHTSISELYFCTGAFPLAPESVFMKQTLVLIVLLEPALAVELTRYSGPSPGRCFVDLSLVRVVDSDDNIWDDKARWAGWRWILNPARLVRKERFFTVNPDPGIAPGDAACERRARRRKTLSTRRTGVLGIRQGCNGMPEENANLHTDAS
jgi:hypothetical protein